jgi:hypothetical protein
MCKGGEKCLGLGGGGVEFYGGSLGKTRCQNALQEWSRYTFGVAKRSLKSLTKRLETLQRKKHLGNLHQIYSLQAEINTLLEMEDV